MGRVSPPGLRRLPRKCRQGYEEEVAGLRPDSPRALPQLPQVNELWWGWGLCMYGLRCQKEALATPLHLCALPQGPELPIVD